jgi:predicted phosphodiesterase
LGVVQLRNLKRNNIKKDYRLRLTKVEHDLIKDKRNKDNNNILVIGDLHEPFCLDEYLDFCIEQYYRFNCNQVIFIGDIIDSHGFSYHEQDPDGYSAGNELKLAIKRVARWYNAFNNKTVPNGIDVCIGNHDRMAARKSMTGGIPSAWIRSYNEVLNTPDWNWVENVIYNDVLYEHGEGGAALTKAKNNMMSSVCGHTHTSCYVQWLVGKKFRVFACQTGCGVDNKSYATAYAKNFKKQAIGCAVVLNNGELPINLLMEL